MYLSTLITEVTELGGSVLDVVIHWHETTTEYRFFGARNFPMNKHSNPLTTMTYFSQEGYGENYAIRP
jgi:hypothetical protein